MTDIRKSCKIFLDFVYESDLIPEKIVKILNQPLANGEKFSGDFRKILSIIAYNNQYGNGRYEYNDFEKQIVDNRDDFRLISEDRLKWLSLNRPTLLTTQKYCNEFFHNVTDSQFEEAFIQNLISLLQSAVFLPQEKRLTYISLIKELAYNNMGEYVSDIATDSSKIIAHKKSAPSIERSNISDEAIIVAYCFSTYDHSCLYPTTSLNDALIDAAQRLDIKVTTLKNIRDAFDGHNDSPRKGWWQKPLSPRYQYIKDIMQQKTKEEVIKLAKGILKI